MSSVPEGWEEIDLGMSNFDHSIDEGFAERLQEGHCYGRHAAWDFNGLVWFADGQFHEEVWCYGVRRQVFSADTLEELMQTVNAKWGSQ